jgi:multidrug efflux system membrane fusion protein
MKRWIKWGAMALVVVLLASGILRALSARKAQQATLAAQSAQGAQTIVELAPSDVVQVKLRTIAQGLPISGALKAVNSATLKARVAGELQGLSVREGDWVKAGQVIARVDPIEYEARLRQAQRQAESAKAQVDIALRNYANNQSLVDQGFISKTALDTTLANLESAQANFKAAQAGADVAAKALDDTVLRSPIAGQVAQRLTQPGERVGIDAKVVEIVDLSSLELEASLSASESQQVRVGQQALLQIEGGSQPVSAKVVRVNPSVQAGSRAVMVYLALDSTTGLRQGLFAQGTLGTASTEALSLPLSAVRTDKPQPYVQAVQNKQIVHLPVELGARGDAEGQPMVAVKGIADQATVVNASVGPLREGTAVTFTAAGK